MSVTFVCLISSYTLNQQFLSLNIFLERLFQQDIFDFSARYICSTIFLVVEFIQVKQVINSNSFNNETFLIYVTCRGCSHGDVTFNEVHLLHTHDEIMWAGDESDMK